MLNVLVCAILTFGLASLSAATAAENHALLIGVGQYDNAEYTLKGPGNDVRVMADVLLARGFSSDNIRMLADDMGGEGERKANGRPTLEAIRKEFEGLLGRTQNGDYVYLHFSGHGATQPSSLSSATIEPDGLDEIFLPANVGTWAEQNWSVENALVDDEIAELLNRLRARGVFVWAVFDACNSGTMTRGAASGQADYRKIEASQLGIPVAYMTEALSRAPKGRGRGVTSAPFSVSTAEEGGLVAFFAARSGQLALERLMPRGKLGVPKKIMGVFTYALAQSLSEYPDASYRQIAERMTQLYSSFDPGVPTPLFEGEMDTTVFASTPIGGEPSRTIEMDEDGYFTVNAGILAGYEIGNSVSLHPFGKPSSDPLGYAVIVEADLNHAFVEPVSMKGIDAPKVSDLPKVMSAHIVVRHVDFQLRVALPPAGDIADDHVESMITSLQQQSMDQTLPISWVDGDADLYLRIAKDRLWLVPSTGEWQQSGRYTTPSVPLREGEEAVIVSALQRVAKFQNLLRIQSAPESRAALSDLKVETFLLKGPVDVAQSEGRCPRVSTTSVHRDAHVVDTIAMPQLKHCDTLFIRITNIATDVSSIDVTPLFLDSQYGVGPVWKEGNREIQSGVNGSDQSVTVGIRIRSWNIREDRADTVGVERLMLIAAKRPATQSFPVSFSHLAQASVRSTTRGASATDHGQGSIGGLLESGAFARSHTRGNAGSDTASQGTSVGIDVIRWMTVPALDRDGLDE